MTETRLVCKHRYQDDPLQIDWLASQWIYNDILMFGELATDIKEEILEDEDEDGEDRTGNYCVKMRLDRDIPQLLPMWGRRIKIFYVGIQKFCTNCFGKHLCTVLS